MHRGPSPCRAWRDGLGKFYQLRVVVLDAAAADVVGPPGTGALAAAPAAAAAAAGLVAAEAEDEEDRGDEEGGPGAPAEAKGVTAERGVAAGGLEGITGLDEGGAGARLACLPAGRGTGYVKTHVIRETARVRKKRPVMATRPAMAEPRRPQQARKEANQARTMKKRAIM